VKRRAASALALLALAAAALAPPLARGDVVGAAGAFTLRGSNGYRIVVLASSRRADGRGEVIVFVGGRSAGVSYFAPANVTDAHIEADLGRLGTFAVKFVASGETKKEGSSCSHDRASFEAGNYEGTIEFRGEENYTQASATSVAAEIKPFLDLLCPGQGEVVGSGPGLPGAQLKVRTMLTGQRESFTAGKNTPSSRARFEATIFERREGIAISRGVETIGGASAFEYDSRLSFGRVKPPSPFSGTAVFRPGAPRSSRWRGNLSVDFPGHSNAPLTAGRPSGGLSRVRLAPIGS